MSVTSSNRRSNLLRLGVVAVVVAVGGAAAGVIAGRDPYPDHWDERVAELVEFVEDERGYDFEHAVPIDFLTDAEYGERTRTDTADLEAEAVEQAEQSEGFLRAVGLVNGDIDLIESSNDLTDTGTLAYYDFEAERIIVRGTEVDVGLAVTLVHELTHVLQDQIFGLDRLAGDVEEAPTSGALLAFRALVEGDARRIEYRYLDELDDDDRAAVLAANDEGLDAIDAEGIPEALEAFFALPYVLGEGFMAVLEADGDGEIDDAFTSPPASEEHLLDPLAYLRLDEPTELPVPDIGDAEVLDSGDFGAASLYLVLAARIDAHQALAAATGWGADSYASFERDDRSCVLLEVRGDTPADTDELASALEAWVASSPAGSASVTRDGEVVALDACDPGVEAAAGTGSSFAALTLAATRAQLSASAIDGGETLTFAACFGQGAIDRLTLDEATGTEVPPDLDARLGQAAAACR